MTEIRRGLGDRRGPDISDPLLTHQDARQARGTHEIDAAASAVEIAGTTYFAAVIEPGTLVDLIDRRNIHRVGIVDEVEEVFSRADLTTFTADVSLRLEVQP